MRYQQIILIPAIVLSLPAAFAQVTLQPWVEVFGTVNGQQLGKYVTGIAPSANLPYKAAVSKVGNTGIYRLQVQTDTLIRQNFLGENLLTGYLNGDAYTDVVVTRSVNGWDTVLVYWGTASGIDTLSPLVIPGENQFDNFGARVIGDVNNDGRQDLIISAPGYPDPLGYGKMYFFIGPLISSTANRVLLGDTVRAHLGMVAVGDLNNDGLNDLALGGYSTAGPQDQWYKYLNINYALSPDSIPLQRSARLTSSASAGGGLACFDVNGDGKADLLWTVRDSLDWVNVHYGGFGFDTIPNLRLRNPFPGIANYASVIANAGDMNGDGYNDVIIGCPAATTLQGLVIEYSGGPSVDGTFDAAAGQSSGSYFGRSIASLGDITGDGLSDIIVGAPFYPDFPPIEYQKGYWGVFKGDSTIRVTDVHEILGIAKEFHLDEAFPNPFNPSTTIRFRLGESAHITIEVFDLLGRNVRTLASYEYSPGLYTIEFDASGLSSGVYFCQMRASKNGETLFQETKRLTLLK